MEKNLHQCDVVLHWRTRWRAYCFLLSILFAFALFTGCVQTTEEASDITPLMWKVTSLEDRIMYLFGSIHAAKQDIYPLPATIMDAFNSCDSLAVEANIYKVGSGSVATYIDEKSMYKNGGVISDEIDSDLYERARTTIKELGVIQEETLHTLDFYRPVKWIGLLNDTAYTKAGLSTSYGLDMYFLKEATKRHMEILEIESLVDVAMIQIRFSLPLQEWLLQSALDVESAALSVTELYNLWKAGDLQALVELLFSAENDDMPDELNNEYNDAIIIQRNLHMADMVERYFSDRKTVFYVVGLQHYLEKDGIVELLTQRGYTVERIEMHPMASF